MSDTRTDEHGNVLNPPGPPGGDPGRTGLERRPPAEPGCEPQTQPRETRPASNGDRIERSPLPPSTVDTDVVLAMAGRCPA